MMDIRSNKVLQTLFPALDRIGDNALILLRTETLIVWTEPSGTDMALSFQEAEGCAVIWFVILHALSFAIR